jgi:hypothetical protein
MRMQRRQGGFEAPYGDDEQAAVPFTPGPGPARPAIDQVLERNTPALRAIEGVAGVGHGRTPTGDDAIVIHVRDASVRDRLPRDVEGYPVEVIVVPGGFDIQDQGGGPSAS